VIWQRLGQRPLLCLNESAIEDCYSILITRHGWHDAYPNSLRCDKETQSLPVIIVSGRPRGNLDTWNGQALGSARLAAETSGSATCLRNALKQVLHDDKRPHVLHVEDDLDIRQVIRALLEEEFATIPMLPR